MCCCGFYPFTKVEHSTTDWWGARPLLWHEDQTLSGGLVELNGVGFGLSLFPINRGYTEVNGVKNPFRGSLERPDYMEYKISTESASGSTRLVPPDRAQVHRLHHVQMSTEIGRARQGGGVGH